jgi:hypothetical protein
MQSSDWLKKQVFSALMVSTLFSVIVFFAVLIIIGSKITFPIIIILMFGGVLGIKLSTRNPVNPLYFVPLWRKNLKMTNEEVITALAPYWERFPHYWLYITLIILMLPFIAIVILNKVAENASTPYIIPSFIIGILMSGSFVPSVYLFFVYFNWVKD